MTVYVDAANLRRTLSLTGSTFANDDIDAACAAASGGLERELGRDFGKTDADQTRYFEPADGWTLAIDDLVTLTTLRVDRAGDGTWEALTVDDDFRLGPLNADVKNEPWQHITAVTSAWPTGRLSLVEIVGVFGWPEPPQQIVEAATIIASQLVKRKRDAPFGFVISADGAAYIARNDPQIAFLLKDLGRRSGVMSIQLG